MQTPFLEYLETLDNIACWNAQGLITGAERIERKRIAKIRYNARKKADC